jgi:hypothetical protein
VRRAAQRPDLSPSTIYSLSSVQRGSSTSIGGPALFCTIGPSRATKPPRPIGSAFTYRANASHIVSCVPDLGISGIIESKAGAGRGLVSRRPSREEAIPTCHSCQVLQLVLLVRLFSLGILVMIPHFALQSSRSSAAITFPLILEPDLP